VPIFLDRREEVDADELFRTRNNALGQLVIGWVEVLGRQRMQSSGINGFDAFWSSRP